MGDSQTLSAAQDYLLNYGPTGPTTNGGNPFGDPQGPQTQHVLYSQRIKQNKNPYEVNRRKYLITFLIALLVIARFFHVLLISYVCVYANPFST